MRKVLLAVLLCGTTAALLRYSLRPLHAAGGFSNASLSGTYAFVVSGQFSDNAGALAKAPISATGFTKADGAGHLTGAQTANLDGTVCQEILSGTYSVNPDGTGTSTATATPVSGSPAACSSFAGSSSNAFTMLSNKFVYLSGTDSDTVLHGEAQRQKGGGSD